MLFKQQQGQLLCPFKNDKMKVNNYNLHQKVFFFPLIIMPTYRSLKMPGFSLQTLLYSLQTL